MRRTGSRLGIGMLLSALAVTAVLLWLAPVAAEEGKVSLDALTTETQKSSDKPDEMTLVWWIPDEFWEVSFSQDDSMTAEEIKDFMAMVKPYTVVLVADGIIGDLGDVEYKDEATLRAAIQLKDSAGKLYKPLADKKVGTDTRLLASVIKPMLKNMLGPMGESMQMFFFPRTDAAGKPLITPKKPGKFSILLDTREFKWRTPLGSLLPVKACPKCGEALSGAYNYCPYDGTKLPDTPVQ